MTSRDELSHLPQLFSEERVSSLQKRGAEEILRCASRHNLLLMAILTPPSRRLRSTIHKRGLFIGEQAPIDTDRAVSALSAQFPVFKKRDD
jgi:hypothetical protein